MALATTYGNTLIDTALTGTVTLALFTDEPTGDSAGTEVTGGGYARQTIAWDASSGKVAKSNGAVTFPLATAAYGTVTHVALYVSTTRRLMGTMAVNRSIGEGDQFVFADESVTVTGV